MKSIKADLHIHTTASDGKLTPQEVVDWAIKKNINAIAITDHDTVDGIDNALDYSEKFNNIYIIPGIELSCVYDEEEVHILGYFIDYKSTIIKRVTENLKKHRKLRGEKIIEKLNSIGIDIKIGEVKELCLGNYIGRPHIARVLVKDGYAKDIQEAFDKYLVKGKAGYVSRYKLSVNQAINLIHSIGGLAVLAHPALIKNINIHKLVSENAFDGIEVYHSKHLNKDISYYDNLTTELNLIKTGGSDCHGEFENDRPILGDYFIRIKGNNLLTNKLNLIKRRKYGKK